MVRSGQGDVRLSVIIPTWNAADLVLEAVGYLHRNEPPSWAELLVVDDGSTDDTVDRVRRQFPNVRVIRQASNRGFGAAVNVGFQAASGQYLGTINNDALVSWSCLAELVTFLEGRSSASAAAPRLQNFAAEWQRVDFDFPRMPWRWMWHRMSRRRRQQGDQVMSPNTPRQVEYLRGACLVFRRDALEQVGLFDEQFFMFAEELDLFRRLDAAGWTAWVVPTAVAQHAGGKSSRGHEDRAVSSRFRRHSYRSICRYYRKHHAWPVALVLRATLAARISGRLARALLDWGLGRSDVWWVREHAACLAAVLRSSASSPVEPHLSRDTRNARGEK